jgi:hypothetical protein
MAQYVMAVRSDGNAELKRLWDEHVIDPYWSEWAEGQFNEERIRKELGNPVSDIGSLEAAAVMLASSGIEVLLRDTYARISRLLPPPDPDKTVCVYANIGLDESVHGVVGACAGDNILIQVNPAVSGWQSYVPWVLAHEYNHTVWGYNHYYLKGNMGQDLLTAIISEGEADSFAKAVCGEAAPYWIRALAAEQEREQWHIIKGFLYREDSMELHVRFFFGDGEAGTPPYTGYTIGYSIVQGYLKARPDTSFHELAGKDAKEILEVSGYDGGCRV